MTFGLWKLDSIKITEIILCAHNYYLSKENSIRLGGTTRSGNFPGKFPILKNCTILRIHENFHGPSPIKNFGKWKIIKESVRESFQVSENRFPTLFFLNETEQNPSWISKMLTLTFKDDESGEELRIAYLLITDALFNSLKYS